MKQATKLVSLIGQKGGVGKSSLARLLCVGAVRQGRKVLLADFDLDQLTCLEWNAARLRHDVQPDIDVRPFKSLKKLRKMQERFDLIVADTRGFADDLSKDVAEESSVVFLPTGTSADDLRPTLALAHRLADAGADGKIMMVLSKTGRSERRLASARERIKAHDFPVLTAVWSLRDGLQSQFDSGKVGLESSNRYLRKIAESVARGMLARVFA